MQQPVDEITGQIVDAAYHVYRRLGPGLLESVCQGVLATELERRGLRVERNKAITVEIDNQRYAPGFRVDLFVNGQVVVEVKSVEILAPVHFKQLLTYLRLLNLPVGLLINFGSARFRDGIRRVVNNYQEPQRSGEEAQHDQPARGDGLDSLDCPAGVAGVPPGRASG